MHIDPDACDACGDCLPYCPVEAIDHAEGVGEIDADLCVECYACLRAEVCPNDAFREDVLEWPRILRHTLSAVQPVQSGTGLIDGRGTPEMKTNDVTGRFAPGEVGFTVDVGRPGLGASLLDVERIARAAAAGGGAFVAGNPITHLMTDTATGAFREDVLGERVLSCVLEFKAPESETVVLFDALRAVAAEIDTVFSVGIITRCDAEGRAPLRGVLAEAGIAVRENGKVNIGLGRRPV